MPASGSRGFTPWFLVLLILVHSEDKLLGGESMWQRNGRHGAESNGDRQHLWERILSQRMDLQWPTFFQLDSTSYSFQKHQR